jgi:hypothetical protein
MAKMPIRTDFQNNKGVSIPMSEKKRTTRRHSIRATAIQATPEHERHIKTAIQLLLTEWVRQRLAKGENHVQQRR